MKAELGRCGAKSAFGHGLCLHLAARGCSGQPAIKVVSCQVPSVMLTVSGLFISSINIIQKRVGFLNSFFNVLLGLWSTVTRV